MPELQLALRYVVFATFAASVLVALASWLVRTRRISPFGALGRTLRAASDPLIRPIEARLVRAGGNPVHAGWWLAVGVRSEERRVGKEGSAWWAAEWSSARTTHRAAGGVK